MLTCAHKAQNSTSAPLFFGTSGKETEENDKISPGQLALGREKRIKRQQRVGSAGCRVLEQKAVFLMASMSSYRRFRPIQFSHSKTISVPVPQDGIRGPAIPSKPRSLMCPTLVSEHRHARDHCGRRRRGACAWVARRLDSKPCSLFQVSCWMTFDTRTFEAS